jgi:hypothetical protein
MNRTLFDDYEYLPEKKELIIVAKPSLPLSKLQKDFNRLTVQIDKLEKKLESENTKIDRLLKTYSREINPLKAKNTKALHAFILVLHQLPKRFTLSKKTMGRLGEIILEMVENLFSATEATLEMTKIYDHWSPMSYKESLEIEKEQERNMFAGFMEDIFGLDLDGEDLDLDDPVTQQRLKEKIEARQTESDSKQSERKKTKKQLEKEVLKKAEDDLNAKNIRSIYIALTKVLHPDMEVDPDKKAEKEELMKTVTGAYEQKDLPMLLKLEMHWLNTSANDLAELPENKLKTFVKVLRKRVADLKGEGYHLYMHPRCNTIRKMVHLKEDDAFRFIMQEVQEFRQEIEELSLQKSTVENTMDKTTINALVTDLHEEFVDVAIDFDSIFGGW